MSKKSKIIQALHDCEAVNILDLHDLISADTAQNRKQLGIMLCNLKTDGLAQVSASRDWSLTEAGEAWLKDAGPQAPLDKIDNEFGPPGANLAHVPTENPINHPPHYTAHPSGIECIQITEHMNFNLGNAIKYCWRAALKGRQKQDLEKARWYIQREIERLAAQDSAYSTAKMNKP